MADAEHQSSNHVRIRVFIDYWNFQLTLNELESKTTGNPNPRISIDWKLLGSWLAEKAAEKVGVTAHSFDGVSVYTSYNPATEEGKKFNKWATTWLNRQPGVEVYCLERRSKHSPKCPSCHKSIESCPHDGCHKPMKATIEKGVDTLIATDMIRLAWEEAYDIAVIASLDADLVPAVKFLNQKGRKVIQAGFPPGGTDLATACWASFDVFRDRKEIIRK